MCNGPVGLGANLTLFVFFIIDFFLPSPTENGALKESLCPKAPEEHGCSLCYLVCSQPLKKPDYYADQNADYYACSDGSVEFKVASLQYDITW